LLPAAALYAPLFLGLETICREVIMVVRRQWWGGMEKGIYDGEMLVHVLRSEI
jgi:hypothetical protein